MVGLEQLRQISSQDFAILGMQNLAYVKRVVVNDEVKFEVHAADGTEVGVFPDRDVADAALLQHDLVPLSVH